MTYQWYTGSNKYYMEKIDGATSMTYQLTPEETAAAGIRYYRCDATNVVDVEGVGKLPFTKRSNIVTVTTELNYITPPKILRQLGTFVTTRDERLRIFIRRNITPEQNLIWCISAFKSRKRA